MDFIAAKKDILVLAEKINNDTLTVHDLMAFVLGFRHEIFETRTLTEGVRIYNAISCSCAADEASCVECGPGFTTGFQVMEDNQVFSFKIKKV